MILPRAQLSWRMLLPTAQPLTFQTTIPRIGKIQPLALSLDSTLDTADSLVCSSLFVWNPSPGFMLGGAADSWSSP